MHIEQPPACRRSRAPWVRLLAISIGLLAAAGGVWLWPRPQADFGRQVERTVAAGVPVGTPVDQAHQWIRSNPAADDMIQYGPAGLLLHRLGGRSAAECAGVPPDGLREVTCFRVRARGGLGIVTDQAWVYLLVGEDGRIRGHYVTTDDPPPVPSQSSLPPRPWWRLW